eukprot:COSAG02_NODE_7403_length_3033_cov_3.831970_5_plen_100_part_00
MPGIRPVHLRDAAMDTSRRARPAILALPLVRHGGPVTPVAVCTQAGYLCSLFWRSLRNGRISRSFGGPVHGGSLIMVVSTDSFVARDREKSLTNRLDQD